MRAIAAKMCVQPKFVNMAFSGLFPALIAKRLDVINSQVGITDVRKETFDFVPVFVGGVRIVAGKSTGLQFQSELDTCGSTMAIMGGSTQMAALEKVQQTCPADKKMVLKAFGGQAEALNEVARGSAQAAFVDWAVATYAAKQRPDQYAVASPILSGKVRTRSATVSASSSARARAKTRLRSRRPSMRSRRMGSMMPCCRNMVSAKATSGLRTEHHHAV